MPFGFFSRPPKPFTRIFFATDLHGSMVAFRKFAQSAEFYKAQVLIMGGDVSGKVLVPVIRNAAGVQRLTLQGETLTLSGATERRQVEERMRALGQYWVDLDEGELEAIQQDEGRKNALFQERVTERFRGWLEELEERLTPTGVRCYVTGGNDDEPELFEEFRRRSYDHVIFAEGTSIQIDEWHTLVSVGFSNRTPWDTPREVEEPELARVIREALTGVEDFRNVIFNFHCPPYDTTLDLCPQLDTSVYPPRPVVKGGTQVMAPAGSTSVREAIERHQPLLGLHGHIHESRAVIRMGRTTCINPGSEYAETVLRGCLVNVGDGQVVGYQMTSG
ncbi:MAG: metallophosphoesterase family protein [Gemmatimonadales bacterium]